MKKCKVCNCRLFEYFDRISMKEDLCFGCWNRIRDRAEKNKKENQHKEDKKIETKNGPVTKVRLDQVNG